MRKSFLIILFFLLASHFLHAQVLVKGNIKTFKGEELSFVNVAVFSLSDTTKLVAGSITDVQGDYVLPALHPGLYKFVVSAVGYLVNNEYVHLHMPSVGYNITKDFLLKEGATVLGEVVVKGSHKSVYAGKSVYTFTKEQIKNARYSYDLLPTISHLLIDMQSGKISKIGGGNVKILINGVNSTENDLKSIPPDKVLKVEYYDIPPARYAAVGALVNVITKRLDTGWNGGIDALKAFNTGFSNDNAYLKYATGRQQFVFDYSLHYRNYRDRRSSETYKFNLKDEEIDEEIYKKDKFGYITNEINLKYTNSVADDYTLQVSLSPNFDSSFSRGGSSIQQSVSKVLDDITGDTHNNVHTFGPSIDTYFSKKIKNGKELDIDVVGTYYHNNQKK